MWISKCQVSWAGRQGKRVLCRESNAMGWAATWKSVSAQRVNAWWEVLWWLSESLSTGGPGDSAAPVWSRMCPADHKSFPGQPQLLPSLTGCSSPGTSPKPLPQPCPQRPLAFSGCWQCMQGLKGHSPVPVTSESYYATDQSGMRVQERREGEADGSMFF